MTGTEFERMRRGYKVTSAKMAEILGVSMSTVYRWEQHADSEAPIEPGTIRLIHAMNELLDAQGNAPAELLKHIQRTGGLLTLYFILREYFNRCVPELTHSPNRERT